MLADGVGAAAGLEATVRLVRGELRLDVELAIGRNEMVAVLGPNGAGKTTLLRVLAGLLAVDSGSVRLDGRALDDPSAGTWVPTEHRAVGVVFQDHLLFPHLSALDNVAFGLRSRGERRADARRAALGLLDRMGLADHAGARPSALSGGQAQRVALARALAVRPRLLLLDEPLAALDAATRIEVRGELRRHLATFDGARLLVTHDPVDAMVLADRMVVLEDGRVVQQGTAADISRHPRSPYVARLVGANLYRGTATGTTLRLLDGGQLQLAEPPSSLGEVFATIRPQSVALFRSRPDGTPRNVWEAVVVGLDVDRDRVRVELAGAVPIVAEVTPAGLAELGLRPGASTWVAVKATDVVTYAA